ncbi:MAG: 30S ribosome-binding factor RbfA [Gammaproteobacteria bacterium]|nr:30S ribosome-binding factor RbfA [Gammaproteobacteria bacterium]NNF61131.1 30S ribosome-binding factor RbfA [Gammaproteobacteria bacterium]
MAREFHRSDRVGEEIQRSLSEIIRDELDDPRLRLITLTEVRVTRDLGHARVFFTSLDDGEHEPLVKALERASGFLRGELGRRLVIRAVPQLHFEYDVSLEQGQRLRSLIDQAVADDRERAAGDEED